MNSNENVKEIIQVLFDLSENEQEVTCCAVLNTIDYF